MSLEEYTELKSRLDAVTVQDVHLGRALFLMASYLPGYSDAEQAKAEADAQARAEAEAEAAKAAEPAQPAGEPSA